MSAALALGLLSVLGTARADTPVPPRAHSDQIQWNEARVSRKITHWKSVDLVAAQVVFRSALEGDNPCGFSPEYLTSAPQLFQGELDSRRPPVTPPICGKSLPDLSRTDVQACAKTHRARVCSRLK